MNFKDAIAFIFVVAAFLIMFMVGFNIISNDGKYDLIVVGWAAFLGGYIIHEFIPPPA